MNMSITVNISPSVGNKSITFVAQVLVEMDVFVRVSAVGSAI